MFSQWIETLRPQPKPRKHGADIMACVGCFALGALTMYYLDPDRGRSRRSLLMNKMVGVSNRTSRSIARLARHAQNHAYGMAHELRHSFMHEEVDDDTLEARIRSHLGHALPTLSGVRVQVRNGCATVTGRVQADMAHQILKGIASTRGVRDIINRLEIGDFQHHRGNAGGRIGAGA
jgi:osmotically-inducible protein OsmY